MKITIYELLGLVKDGKAPKKIKFRNEIYEYKSNIENNFIDYVGTEKETSAVFYLSSHIGNNYINDIFTDEVEIIEEPKKMKKIEMVGCNVRVPALNNEIVGTDTPLALETAIVKVNELIDEVNKLKEGKL